MSATYEERTASLPVLPVLLSCSRQAGRPRHGPTRSITSVRIPSRSRVCLKARSRPGRLPSQGLPRKLHDFCVYVPAQCDAATPAALMIFRDGQAWLRLTGDYRVPSCSTT
jgi:hypothetical protein